MQLQLATKAKLLSAALELLGPDAIAYRGWRMSRKAYPEHSFLIVGFGFPF